jgi:hypothetical protein
MVQRKSNWLLLKLRVVEVNQNYFELKYKLEMEWKSEKIFLYHPLQSQKVIR